MTQPRYAIRGDLYYDPATHLWLAAGGGRLRVGLDPIGAETSGDLVAMSFVPAGTPVARGEAFGSLEAAKFVGPLLAPISGVVRIHNEAVLANPGLVQRAPFDAWLVEIEPADGDQLAGLITGERAVAAWFDREIERYRKKGMLAE